MGNPLDDLERLLTPKEVAEKLRIGLSTVYYLVNHGKLPALKIGTTLRFRADSLARHIKELEKQIHGGHE